MKDGRLVAACQRDTASHYSHMAREEDSIRRDLVTFFREQIRDKFPLSSYVFDVTRPGKDRVILMDFNPFGNPTDTLLFESWEDINEIQVIVCRICCPSTDTIRFRQVNSSHLLPAQRLE